MTSSLGAPAAESLGNRREFWVYFVVSEMPGVVGGTGPSLKTRWDIPALSRGEPPGLAKHTGFLGSSKGA